MKQKLSTFCMLLTVIVLANFNSFSQAPTLGANFQGGKVGYILKPGDPGYNPSLVKGLIAAPSNLLTPAPWAIGSYLINITNVTTDGLGAGAANTTAIVNLMGPGNYMAYQIDTSTINGYSDWYMPSEAEMIKLLANRLYWIPGINVSDQVGPYATTNEFGGNVISGVQYSYGELDILPFYKSNNSPSIAVRSFSYNPCATTTSTTTITNCGSYTWNGSTYSTSGTYSTTLVNAGGCDSIATLNLTIKQAPGCVTNGLKIWVKANQGFTYTETANAVGWADASGNGNDAKVFPGESGVGEPGVSAGNPGAMINFNPAIEFDGNEDMYYFDYALSTGYSMFGVSKQYDFSTEYQRIFSDKNSNFLMGNWNRYEDNLYMNGDPAELFITPQTNDVKLHDLIRQNNETYRFQKNGITISSGAASDGTAIQPTLGGSGQFGEFAFAHIPEFIAYDTALTTTEQQKVESYLAVKYGLTLGSQANPYTYLASDGSIIWTGSAMYYNNITVIGRDDNAALMQKQSTSVNGGKITISIGNTIATDNASNAATISADKKFLAIGSNGVSGTIAITGMTGPTRSAEVWKVKETNGDIGSVTIKFTGSRLYRFLLVSTTENFSTGTVTEHALNSNNEVTVNLTDGSYFALGTNCILTRTFNASACNQYIYNGNTYTTSGIYQVDTIYNASGCDSVILMDLSIKSSSVPIVTTVTNCNAYNWHGQSYISVGSYTWTGTNAAGCDSIEVLNVISNSVSNSTLTLGQDFQGGKIGYILQPGDAGYDSTMIKGLIVGSLNVLPTGKWGIDPYIYSYTNVTSSSFGTGAANTAALVNLLGPGNYMAYHIDTATINGYSDWYLPSSQEATILLQNRFYWIPGITPTSNSNWYWTSTESTSSPDRGISIAYRVSVNQILLSNTSKFIVNPPLPVRSFAVSPAQASISTTTVATCGDYTWHGQTYNSVGTYTWSGTRVSGCDSIEYLNLVSPDSLSIGQTIQGGKIGYVLQPGDPGYDSTKIKGWILGPIQSNRPWAIGSAQSTLLNITQNGIGMGAANTAALVNNMGPGNYMAYAIDTATYGGYSDWYMATLDEVTKVVFASYSGGDPSLSFGPAYLGFPNNYYIGSANEYNATSIFLWDWRTYNIFGKSTANASSYALPMRNFEFTKLSSTTTQVSCGSYQWNGNTYTTSGTYIWSGRTAFGCDSIAKLNLTIKQPSTSITTISNCGAYNWHGQTYIASGTYTWTGTNAVGCDSVVTLNLTIKQPTTSTSTITASSSYSWNGTNYTSSGIYTWTGTNEAGCDSVATLNLTINILVSNVGNVCSYIGTDQSLTYTANVAGASSYAWTLPANTQLISGQGTRSIVIKILNGFANQPNKQIRVTPAGGSLQVIYLGAQAPVTPSPIVASSTNICQSLGTNVPITFTIPRVYELASNGSTATSYLWTAQNGTTSIIHPNGTGFNDTTISVIFASNFTSSNITVQSLNSCGVSGPRSYIVTLNNPSQPGLISGPTNICEYIGEAGQFATYSILADSSAASYTWTVPQNAIGLTGQGTRTISFKYPAGYTSGSISVVATNNCGTSSSRSLSVSKLNPSMPGIIDVISAQDCPNRVYNYSLAAMPSNATSLFWTIPSAGILVSGQGTRSITVSYPATVVDGYVSVKAIANCGASSTRISSVKLAPCSAGPSSTYTKGLITSNSSMDVKVFPNPTSSSFHLQIGGIVSEDVTARVLDIQGRLIKTIVINPNEIITIGSELKPGVYMLEVIQGEERKMVRVVKY